MSAQGLLRQLQRALGVLDAARLQELNHSLLVGRHSAHLANHLPDQLHSLAQDSLFGDGMAALGFFLGNFEFGDRVALVLAERNHSWMGFSHGVK